MTEPNHNNNAPCLACEVNGAVVMSVMISSQNQECVVNGFNPTRNLSRLLLDLELTCNREKKNSLTDIHGTRFQLHQHGQVSGERERSTPGPGRQSRTVAKPRPRQRHWFSGCHYPPSSNHRQYISVPSAFPQTKLTSNTR